MDFVALDQQKHRSKYIDTRYHYTKERCASGEIELRYCLSEDMNADFLTKPLEAVEDYEVCIGHGFGTNTEPWRLRKLSRDLHQDFLRGFRQEIFPGI